MSSPSLDEIDVFRSDKILSKCFDCCTKCWKKRPCQTFSFHCFPLVFVLFFLQLCATKPGREVVKALGSYYIMRELYNWEKDAESRLACRKLIDVLIADEPDAGMANLRDVDVPEGMREKFEAQEKQDLEDMAQEIEDAATKAGGE